MTIVSFAAFSFKNKAVEPKMPFFCEVGLLGEVRSIGSEERRSKEAKRLGFTTVISPSKTHNLQQTSNILNQ